MRPRNSLLRYGPYPPAECARTALIDMIGRSFGRSKLRQLAPGAICLLLLPLKLVDRSTFVGISPPQQRKVVARAYNEIGWRIQRRPVGRLPARRNPSRGSCHWLTPLQVEACASRCCLLRTP